MTEALTPLPKGRHHEGIPPEMLRQFQYERVTSKLVDSVDNNPAEANRLALKSLGDYMQNHRLASINNSTEVVQSPTQPERSSDYRGKRRSGHISG